MSDKPAPTPALEVLYLYEIDAEIARLQELRGMHAKALITIGAGSYIETKPSAEGAALRTITVVVPTKESISYDLYAAPHQKDFLAELDVKKPTPAHFEAFKQSQEETAKELAEAAFAKLFRRVVIYSPRPSFADLAPALLTPAKARDVIALCEVKKPAPAPYLLMPDKPKKPEPAE